MRAHESNRHIERLLGATCLAAIIVLASTSGMAELVSIESASPQMEIKTQVPVIGVLTEVLRDYKRFVDTKRLHIAASYVKWVEMAGAQVMPVLLNQDDAYYERVLSQTNGLLFPGGDNMLNPNKRTPMMEAAKKLYKLAVDANDRGEFYPIWGTCLGLELLTVLTANRNVLRSCSANDISLGIEFTARGKMFAKSSYSGLDQLTHDYSRIMMDLLETSNLTYNFHHKCVTDEALREANLETFYRPLGYSLDSNGTKFIAIMEAINYPFYGVQFHPEKSPFEFVVSGSQQNIAHSRPAIAVSRFFADFFVMQAQLSGNKRRPNSSDLIYSFEPMFTAPKSDMYEQRYLFAYKESSSISSEEFLDHIPAHDEEIPE